MEYKILWEQRDGAKVTRYVDTVCEDGLDLGGAVAQWGRRNYTNARLLAVWSALEEKYLVEDVIKIQNIDF